MDFSGKVAIVTGGASGIGRGTVQRFVAEGARVVIADVEEDRGEALAAMLGPDVLFRRTDVSDPEQVGALVAATVEKFGGLHVMVNNAGVSGTMHRRFLDDDLTDFHRIMKRPNVVSPFGVGQNDMRASLRFYRVAFSEKCAEDFRGLGAGPQTHGQSASMDTVTVSAGSFCSSMRSASTRNARACADATASFSVAP